MSSPEVAALPRVSYSDGAADPALRTRIEERRGGRLTNLDRMLLHSPPVADGWNRFLGAVRSDTLIDPLLRELIILRVAVINGADYEFTAHTGPARAAGADDAWLAGISCWEDAGVYTGPQRAVLAYTDAMTRSVDVPEDVFEAVSSKFTEREVVEITVTAATYNAVSRFIVALGVDTRGEIVGEGSR